MKTIQLSGFTSHESVDVAASSFANVPGIGQGLELARQAWANVNSGQPVVNGIKPFTSTQVDNYLNRAGSDPVSKLLFTGIDKVTASLLHLPVSTKTVVATILACAARESGFNPNAVALQMQSPSFVKLLAADPDTAMDSHPKAAKGLLQLLPENFKRLYDRVENDPSYAPIKAAMQDAGIFDSIKQIDREYQKLVNEIGVPSAQLGSHPVSQVVPSIAFVIDMTKRIIKDWTYSPDRGWQPTKPPVNRAVLNQLWNIVPGSQADPDLGFALLYNVYHINGPGILISRDFTFHHTEGDNYKRRVDLAAQFIAHPELMANYKQI